MTRDLQVGIVLPSRELEMRPGRSGRQLRDLVDLAVAAEALGMDQVWIGDSPVARPRAEPFTVLGAVAARTETVRLGTAALIPALRHPLHTAHAIATLDQLAPGRLTVAVGAGFPYDPTAVEFAAFGTAFSGREGLLDRIVALWHSLWSGDATARRVAARALNLQAGDEALTAIPKPTTPGGPPIWLAAGPSPANAVRLAGLYDGWLPYLPSAESYAVARGEISEARADRSVAFGLYLTLTLGAGTEATTAQAQYIEAYYGAGSADIAAFQACHAGEPEDTIRFLQPFITAGVRHVVVRLGAFDAETQLRLLADEVVPAIREQLVVSR